MAHGQLTQFQTVALTQFQVDICSDQGCQGYQFQREKDINRLHKGRNHIKDI